MWAYSMRAGKMCYIFSLFHLCLQVESNGEEWAVALYDFTAETEEDLPFQQGDRILVTAHIDDEWWSGRINGREGFFPKAFVEIVTGEIIKWLLASSGQKLEIHIQ